MRSTTNLAWPITPFGAGQRPFGKARPMMATVAVGWAGYVPRPVWACAVYLNIDSTRTLSLDGQHLNFGFEVLTSDSDAHDLGPLRLSDLAAAYEHVALMAATLAEPASTTTAGTARQALTRTLAIALIAARSHGKYGWATPLDLDQLVADTAWDHLADLGR